MAITYTDKVQNAVNPLPVEEQWRAVDANEVKNEVNANIIATAAAQSNIDTHEALTNNPHSVTKSQVGLSNVTNPPTGSYVDWSSSVAMTGINGAPSVAIAMYYDDGINVHFFCRLLGSAVGVAASVITFQLPIAPNAVYVGGANFPCIVVNSNANASSRFAISPGSTTVTVTSSPTVDNFLTTNSKGVTVNFTYRK